MVGDLVHVGGVLVTVGPSRSDRLVDVQQIAKELPRMVLRIDNSVRILVIFVILLTGQGAILFKESSHACSAGSPIHVNYQGHVIGVRIWEVPKEERVVFTIN